ncbi:MAG TPA: DGQHR domain-containing protein [Candidatus Omnitrophota bacterium]|nr:DGQHR domain-containing protein [Candidatus Omnitrophota bacterium]
MSGSIQVDSLVLQTDPPIYIATISGNWLLKHSRPDWRSENPEKGFQRVVKIDRAKQIAAAVLDNHRTFPNAIILATQRKTLPIRGGKLTLENSLEFLVVDGQHRLYSQKFSEFDAQYACILHCGLDKPSMAKLFLEINDTQKRVPSSLRWDLVRLVRPEDDHDAIVAVELVFELYNNEESPLFQRIDLTGEAPDNSVSQGSLAPEIKNIVSKKGLFSDGDFQAQVNVLIIYLAAIKTLDNSGWKHGTSPFYATRVLRKLIQLLPEILSDLKIKDLSHIKMEHFSKYLRKINADSLRKEKIIEKQGAAGMKAIYDEIKKQIF